MLMSHDSLAVLISGGLDSAILLGDALPRHSTIHPLYIRCGMAWECVELSFLHRYLEALHCPALKPLVILEQPIADVYGPHWSTTGERVPDAASPDEAVFLPGRNVLLLAKSLLWCHLRHVPALVLGSLQTNPFPDATPAFFRGFQDIVNQAVGGDVEVQLPFGGMKKTAVMHWGKACRWNTPSRASPRSMASTAAVATSARSDGMPLRKQSWPIRPDITMSPDRFDFVALPGCRVFEARQSQPD